MVYHCEEVKANGQLLVSVALCGIFFFTVTLRIWLMWFRKYLQRYEWYRILPEEKQKQCIFNFTKATAEAVFLIPAGITVYQGTFQATLSMFGMTTLMVGSAYFCATYLNELLHKDNASTISWMHHIGYWVVLSIVYTRMNLNHHDCAYSSSCAWPFFWLATLSFLDYVIGLYNAGYNIRVVSKLLYWVVVFETITKIIQIAAIFYFNYTYWDDLFPSSRFLLLVSNSVWIPADLYLPIAFWALYKKSRETVAELDAAEKAGKKVN